MRIIKICLALAVIGLISYLVFNSLSGSPEKEEVPPSNNTQIAEIDAKIKKLGNLSNDKFSKETHEEIKYLISEYHKNKLLGKDTYQNDQWKQLLSKDLYFIYTDKFISQAYFVLNGTEWKTDNLNFIRKETNSLRSSVFIEKNSSLDNSLVKIQQIQSKYDEINNFIKSSRGFYYSDYTLKSRFPFSDLKSEISKVEIYKSKQQGEYLKNCKRLQNDLDDLKKKLINSYLIYLENKIGQWVGKYKQYDFNSFNEYQTIIYNPLRQELSDFEEKCRGNNFSFDSNSYSVLLSNLNKDRTEAYKFID
jgi:hypothetical protein